MIVAVERTHKPIIFEKCLSCALFVNVSKDYLALEQHFMFLYCFFDVAGLKIFIAVQKLGSIPALSAFQNVFVKFF
jgi:hypothetical protein